MNKKQSSLSTVVLAVLLTTGALYVGTYCALVRPGLPGSVALTSQRWHLQPCPKYRYGGSLAEVLFWPIEHTDRKLRPDAWDIQKAIERNSNRK
jgi:hypothetical protein